MAAMVPPRLKKYLKELKEPKWERQAFRFFLNEFRGMIIARYVTKTQLEDICRRSWMGMTTEQRRKFGIRKLKQKRDRRASRKKQGKPSKKPYNTRSRFSESQS